MYKSTFISKALINILDRTAPKNSAQFDLEKFVRDMLTRMKVPHRDVCCDVPGSGFPVRLNEAKTKLQFYDVATKAWVDVPAGALV